MNLFGFFNCQYLSNSVKYKYILNIYMLVISTATIQSEYCKLSPLLFFVNFNNNNVYRYFPSVN